MPVGDTLMLVPVPTAVPPQLPLYHCHEVASFRVPVCMLNVVALPPHVGFTVAARVGTVGLEHDTTVNTTSFPVPPMYEIVALSDEPRKLLMVAPLVKPANVPVIASAPSLLTMVNVCAKTGV